MRTIHLPLLLGCFMTLTGTAQSNLPGDLNHDGLLNVADLVRLDAMIQKKIVARPDADLNFDSIIDMQDLTLLEDALQGYPLPKLLQRETIGKEGGSVRLADGSFSLTIPPGALAHPTTIAVAQLPEKMLLDYGISTSMTDRPLLVAGVPQAHNLVFSWQAPASEDTPTHPSQTAVLLGKRLTNRHDRNDSWHFQILEQPEDGVTKTEHDINWHPKLTPPPQPPPPTVKASAKAKTSKHPQAPNSTFVFDIVKVGFMGDTAWQSQHFRIYPLNSFMSENEMNQVETLARDLEVAFQKTVDMGFPENKRIENWGEAARKIKVIIRKPKKSRFFGLIDVHEEVDSAFCNPPGWFTPPSMEILHGVLTSNERRETASHEFFHYVQYYYATNTSSTLWLDEMTATWMEGQVSDKGDNYCPGTYKNLRAPINGLYRGGASRFNSNAAGEHGYSASAFAYYLTKRKHAWINDFWHQIYKHPEYIRGKTIAPLVDLAPKLISYGGLPKLYNLFIRNYLSDGLSDGRLGFQSPFGKNGTHSVTIYRNTDQDEHIWHRYPENGKLTKMTDRTELVKQLEQDFQIQDLGAVTWMITFPTPKKVLWPGTSVVMTVNDLCEHQFITLFEGATCKGITKYDTKVTYDKDKKTRSISVGLGKFVSSNKSISLGFVATNTTTHTGDDPEVHPITMSLRFRGLVALPPKTVSFDLWGKRLMDATADLELTAITPGSALGDYDVTHFPGGQGLSQFPLVNVQLNKPLPMILRLKSTITPTGHELQSKDEFGNHVTASAVPTGSALVQLDVRHHNAPDFHHSESHVVQLETLKSEAGLELHLDTPHFGPQDIVHLTVRPTFTVSGEGSGTGENLCAYTIILTPPTPTP